MACYDPISQTRPQKRPRISQPPPVRTASTSNWKRHPELWFDDGSVVMVARNVGFRVFRSLLAEQSTVFADMFSSSSPNTLEMIDGLPVVHLSDTAEDAADFLRVLFKPRVQHDLFSRRMSFDFPKISAIIRLAHKYHVQDVLDQALIYLHEDWFPTTFGKWEAYTAESGIPRGFVDYSEPCVVNIARLTERHSLLPTAFYQCAMMETAVLDGYKRRDVSLESMPLQDIKRSIEGRIALVEKAVEIVSKVFATQPCDQCASTRRCRSALQAMLEAAVATEDASDPDVLTSWDKMIKSWAEEYILCNLCTKAAIERDRRARKEVWDLLPAIFNIEVDGWAPSASG